MRWLGCRKRRKSTAEMCGSCLPKAKTKIAYLVPLPMLLARKSAHGAVREPGTMQGDRWCMETCKVGTFNAIYAWMVPAAVLF